MTRRPVSTESSRLSQLERELSYYRRECNDLGARLLRLQEEQSQAFREARRSRTVAKLIREANRLADTAFSADELDGPMLEVLVENAMCDRAALLVESPLGSGSFRVTSTVGLGEQRPEPVTIPTPPAFFFTTAQTRLEPPAYELAGVLQLPYVLWAFDPASGNAMVIGNRSEENISRAFETGDQELIEGALSVYLDVLARKRAEMQLRLSMTAAEDANEAKAVFLATLSHELRTPLDSIIGFSDLICSGRSSEMSLTRSMEHAAEIRAAGHHLLRLINDILDYSKIARGQIPLQVEWTRLSQVVGAAVRAAAATAERRRVTLHAAPVDERLGVLVDPIRLRQIIDNLLNNAIKFTPRCGRVEIAAGLDGDRALNLVIRDTGVGMRPEDIPRALEAFRQIDNALSRASSGTGLGLPITTGLVQAHGGELNVASELGSGTVVTVTLPPERVHDGATLPDAAQ